MYVTLLKLFLQVSENPLAFVGLLMLLMLSWGLIVAAIYDIAIRLWDSPAKR
jgi:hypothetical protein